MMVAARPALAASSAKAGRQSGLVQMLQPIQERRASFTDSQAMEILENGSNHARVRAEETMRQVRTAMQLSYSSEK